MDKGAEYRALIQRILTDYAAIVARQASYEMESLLAFDEQRDQYLWFQVGWERQHRVYGVTVHARLRDGKVWIEQDWTEDGIATDLVRAGVPRADIVLAFQEPEARIASEDAVA